MRFSLSITEHTPSHPLSIGYLIWYSSELVQNITEQPDRIKESQAFYNFAHPCLIKRKAGKCNTAEGKNSHNSHSTKNHYNAL